VSRNQSNRAIAGRRRWVSTNHTGGCPRADELHLRAQHRCAPTDSSNDSFVGTHLGHGESFVDTHLRHGVEGRGRFVSAARRGIGRCMRPSDNDPGPIPIWHSAQVGARCNVPLLTQAAVETPVRYTQHGSRRAEPLRPLDT
jgi:hypothetical protein